MNFRHLFFLTCATAVTGLHAQTLQLASGHGQVIQEQFMAQRPFTVRAVDAAGRPVPNIPITWSVSPVSAGSLISSSAQTNAQGEASTNFFASNNPPGISFVPANITASSPNGLVIFALVVSLTRGSGGNLVPLPFVQPVSPTQGSTIEGSAGATLPGAVSVRVVAQGGVYQGQPIPNVGLRVETTQPSEGPTASCNAPAGIVVTGENGVATCDLVLGTTAGTVQMQAVVGEYWPNLRFDLKINPGPACTFSATPMTQSFAASGGTATINVSAGQGCSWTAASTAPWISIASGSSGQGNGAVTYSVAANPGTQRSATLTVAGRSVTITQAAAGSTGTNPLSFSVGQALPGATTGLAYSIGLTASGGTPPYRWNATGVLPSGLALNSSTGVISGIPTTAGTYTVPVTLTDAANGSVSQSFSLVISQSAVGSPALVITTTSFPNGTIGASYQQAVTTSGGCSNPFSGPPVIALASGSLPPGLALQALTSGGFGIAGTPTAAGTYPFALRATACTDTTTRQFTITIAGPPSASAMTVTPAELAFGIEAGSVTRPADQTLSVSAGDASMSFGISVSTTAGGNWLGVLQTTGVTPANLNVSIVNFTSLAAGTYRGSITIVSQASNSPVSVPVTLTVAGAPPPPPAPTPLVSAVTNAASFIPGAVAPGEFITIFGTNIGPASPASFRLTPGATLDSTLAETRVLFDDVPAPLVYTSTGQVSAIVPYGVAGRATTRVVLEYRGTRSRVVEMLVVESVPGIFTIGPAQQAAALNQDGTLNAAEAPAPAGSIISLYATGEGTLNPSMIEGTIASADRLARPVLPVSVQIGGQTAEVLYAGVAPGLLAGVLQVNVRIPENATPGASVPVTLTVGANSSRAATVAIR